MSHEKLPTHKYRQQPNKDCPVLKPTSTAVAERYAALVPIAPASLSTAPRNRRLQQRPVSLLLRLNSHKIRSSTLTKNKLNSPKIVKEWSKKRKEENVNFLLDRDEPINYWSAPAVSIAPKSKSWFEQWKIALILIDATKF